MRQLSTRLLKILLSQRPVVKSGSYRSGGGDIRAVGVPGLCLVRRTAKRRPRAFGPLCRPEVGVPSRPRALSLAAVRGFAAPCAAVPL